MTRAVLALCGAAALAVSGSPAAAGGSGPEPLILTLSGAIERALARSEEIRLAREQISRSEAQITQARAGAFPQVTGSIRYERTLRSIFDIDDGDAPPGFDPDDLFADLPFGQRNAWVLGIQVDQAIYTGGRVSSGLDIARRVEESAQLGLDETELEVVQDVRQAYLQALHSRSLVDIAEQSIEVAGEQLELVEAFEARGIASELDVLQARVERDNLRPQLVRAQNAQRLAELELKRLLNISIDRPLELPRSPTADDVEVEITRSDVVEAALRRPSVRAARERIRIHEENIDLARSARKPTVSAFANFSWHAFPEQVVPTSFPGTSEWREDWILGVQVSIPIFEGFRVTGEIDEAQAEWRASVLEERQLRQAVTLQAEAALSELEAARAQIEAQRATVQEAERALELVDLRYEQGMARLIELSHARLLLQRARVNEAEARISYLSALATVEYVTGSELAIFEDM